MTSDRRRYLGVLLCFLLSGFAALLYQTAWAREFAFIFGTSEVAIAVVLAAYMAGLAIGAGAAARWARTVVRPVLAYGILEAGIALCALLVPVAIRGSVAWSERLFGDRPVPPGAGELGLTAFHVSTALAIMIVPTALMGATLPVLARFAVRRGEEIGARVGTLYAVNTAGAVLGTVAAGFVLLPAAGLRTTVHVGVAVNVVVFAVAALVARGAPPLDAGGARAGPRPRRYWRARDAVLPLMLVSGSCSFAYEVLWTRLLAQILGASVYAFSTMLASFLTGIALGSAIASRLARTRASAAIGMAVAQAGTASLSVVAWFTLERLTATLAGSDVGAGGPAAANAGVAALVLLPSTLFIGATFPFAVRVAAGDADDASRPSGTVYAWNTVGAIVGAIGAAFVLIPALGFDDTLRAVATTNLALGAAALLVLAPERRPIAACVVGLGAAAAALAPLGPPEQVLRFSPWGSFNEGEIRYLGIGRSATVLALEQDEKFHIYTNGLPEATIRPFEQPLRERTAKWLTALPVLARPEARSMMVIGLGGGRALERVPATLERVDVVELEEEVVAANRALAGVRARDPLADPRVRIFVNDARGALVLTGHRYDVIVSQPSHPWTAGASHLYTREFFALARSRLRPGGVFVQWIGMTMVDAALLRTLVATMTAVYPHVRVYVPPPGSAFLFLGSDAPLPVEHTAGRAISAARDDLWSVGAFAPEDTLVHLALDEAGSRRFARHAEPSTDDRNLLQTRSPRVGPEALNPAASRKLLAPFDPIESLVADVDRLYLGRRLVSVGVVPRVQAISRVAPDEDERLTLYGIAGLAFGRPDAVAALARAVELDPARYEAAFQLARVRRASVEQGDLSFLPDPGALPPAARTVFRGWRLEAREEWEALATLDGALRDVAVTDPAFLDANRLRALWRLALAGEAHTAVARRLLDRALLFHADPEDYVLRARLAVEEGYPAYALELLSEARPLLAQSARPRQVVFGANALFVRIPPAPALQPRYDRLRTEYRRLLRVGQ